MENFEQLISLMNWAAKNVNYNLDFVPDDKLDWKPGPDCKSVMTIAHEIATSVGSLSNLLANGEMQKNLNVPETRSEAKVAITDAAESYAKALQGLTAEQLASSVDIFGRDMSMKQVIGIPVLEILHHHGQIAYIQTLLGDTEDHFFQMKS